MPVIINDFEIVSERPSEAAAGGKTFGNSTDRAAETVSPASAKPPTALDLRRVREHQIRRGLRLYAH